MDRVLNAKTKIYSIIGEPIEHSKSPAIHNLAFAGLKLNCVFTAFNADNGNIKEVMAAFRTLNIAGGSITMPVKQAAIPFMDKLSHSASLIGAINVFKNDDGVFTGWNTDGLGLIRQLEHNNIEYKGKKIVLAGTGGAGRAVAVELALGGVKELVLFDVNAKSCNALAGVISLNVGQCKVTAYQADEKRMVKEIAEGAAAYIDCTPIGMTPSTDASMINDFSAIPREVSIVDITHTPPETKLARMAREHGCRAFGGMDMVLYQAAEAFKIYTGLEMPLDYVKENLKYI